MDLEQLNIFIKVATLKNFTRAAESLYLSQPTISSRVKALEEEIGVLLFDRSRPRELSLTEEGKIFWDYAQQMLNLYNEFLQNINLDQNSVSGYLRIGASSVPGIFILPVLLNGFKKQYNRVKTSVLIKDSAEVIDGVLDYIFDIGFVGYRENDPRLIFLDIAEDELCLITPAGLLEEKGLSPGDTVPLETFFNLDLILREPGSATRRVLEQQLNEIGFTTNDFKSIMYMDDLEGIKQSVRQGLGSSVVSRYSVEDYLTAGFVDVYNIESLFLKRRFYLVYHQNRVLNIASMSFIQYIQDNIAEHIMNI